mmetsp:Transcript_8110/g.24104  ORF Transcript_8110/g.24104 Transcript_8110/m.24104 type:complete len:217 (+) Transcript_8110:1170-1820(+)
MYAGAHRPLPKCETGSTQLSQYPRASLWWQQLRWQQMQWQRMWTGDATSRCAMRVLSDPCNRPVGHQGSGEVTRLPSSSSWWCSRWSASASASSSSIFDFTSASGSSRSCFGSAFWCLWYSGCTWLSPNATLSSTAPSSSSPADSPVNEAESSPSRGLSRSPRTSLRHLAVSSKPWNVVVQEDQGFTASSMKSSSASFSYASASLSGSSSSSASSS